MELQCSDYYQKRSESSSVPEQMEPWSALHSELLSALPPGFSSVLVPW